MLKQKLSSKRGFTIIEVVLVLAIAGLIFLMVFLALPALQRSQRDTQRRSAYSEFLTQISNYQSNNRGRLPGSTGSSTSLKTAWENFIGSYLRPTEKCYRSPTGEGYTDSEDGDGSECTPETFLDPVGEPYFIEDVIESDKVDEAGDNPLTWEDDKYEIYVYLQAQCDGENAVKSSGARNVAIRVKLEGGGIYCGNN